MKMSNNLWNVYEGACADFQRLLTWLTVYHPLEEMLRMGAFSSLRSNSEAVTGRLGAFLRSKSNDEAVGRSMGCLGQRISMVQALGDEGLNKHASLSQVKILFKFGLHENDYHMVGVSKNESWKLSFHPDANLTERINK